MKNMLLGETIFDQNFLETILPTRLEMYTLQRVEDEVLVGAAKPTSR